MIVGVVSDVHLHVGRLELAARRAREEGAEEVWCLGDVVDSMLGAPPAVLADAIAVAQRTCDVVLAGNHELWALQRGLLDPEAAEAIAGWSAVEERCGVGLVHGSLDDPYMEFVRTAPAAARVLRGTPGWLALHGHTHVRKLWAQTATYPHAVARPTRGVVAAGDDRLLACPGALTGGRPTWLRVDLEARTLQWRLLR